MPPRSDELRLKDIKGAIQQIRKYTKKNPDWQKNLPNETLDAILWNLAAMGEAVKGLSSGAKEIVPEGEWSQIAKMRDALIHRYFLTDASIINNTIELHLPLLEKAVDQLLRGFHGG